MGFKLPHISRFITATILPAVAILVLWGFLAGLVSLNVIFLKTRTLGYSDKLFDVFTHPFDAPTHERLALALWDNGARTIAKQELILAAEFGPQSSAPSGVLGASTTPTDLLRFWQDTPKREAQETKYWQDVAANHPDYRDAYIQLAMLSYARGNLTQTKIYLSQAAALDPNGRTVHDLLGFVENTLQ